MRFGGWFVDLSLPFSASNSLGASSRYVKQIHCSSLQSSVCYLNYTDKEQKKTRYSPQLLLV